MFEIQKLIAYFIHRHETLKIMKYFRCIEKWPKIIKYITYFLLHVIDIILKRITIAIIITIITIRITHMRV